MWKPQRKPGAEPQMGWTKMRLSAVWWPEDHLYITSEQVSVVWQWGQVSLVQIWWGQKALQLPEAVLVLWGTQSSSSSRAVQQPMSISCPSQPWCYLASQQFEECCSWDTAAWRCAVKRGKLPQHLGHSCIYTAQKTKTEKCSRAQSFSTQPVRILKRRGDKPPRASFPLQLLSNLFSCLFKWSTLGNWGSISPRI